MSVCKNQYAIAYAKQQMLLSKCSSDSQRVSVYLKLLNILVQSPKNAPIYDFGARLSASGESVLIEVRMLMPLVLRRVEHLTGKLMAA